MNTVRFAAVAAALAFAGSAHAVDAAKAAAVMKGSDCMACHAEATKLVGPSYKDVAKKYAGNAKAVEMLATKIVKGGSGVWGAIPMPANPQVSAAEATKLATWVMSQK